MGVPASDAQEHKLIDALIVDVYVLSRCTGISPKSHRIRSRFFEQHPILPVGAREDNESGGGQTGPNLLVLMCILTLSGSLRPRLSSGLTGDSKPSQRPRSRGPVRMPSSSSDDSRFISC